MPMDYNYGNLGLWNVSQEQRPTLGYNTGVKSYIPPIGNSNVQQPEVKAGIVQDGTNEGINATDMIYHQGNTGNPIDILKGLFKEGIDEKAIRDQIKEAGGGYKDLLKGGLLGGLNLTGKPITDAYHINDAYRQKYLQPLIDNKTILAQGDHSLGGFVRTADGRIRVDDTIEGRQARIAAGLDKYYDAAGNVRPLAERQALGVQTKDGHYVDGSNPLPAQSGHPVYGGRSGPRSSENKIFDDIKSIGKSFTSNLKARS